MNTHDIELPEHWQAFQYNEGWGSWEQVIPSAANKPGVVKAYTADQVVAAIEADRKRRGEPVAWSGWGCQYPGKMPRLYGDRSIAEINCDRENGDQLLYLTAASQPAEPVKVPSENDLWPKGSVRYFCDRCGLTLGAEVVLEISRDFSPAQPAEGSRHG